MVLFADRKEQVARKKLTWIQMLKIFAGGR